jgi:hypothetical protein
MMRRLTLVVVLPVIVAMAASASYGVLTLPEPGEVQRPALPLNDWLKKNGRATDQLRRECEAVNDTATGRETCFVAQIEDAQTDWQESRDGADDLWTASEIATSRNSYLGVAAVVLFGLAVGLLAVRTMTGGRVTPPAR